MTDIICPKCKKGYMEEDDESEDEMTEGQEANYFAGFNHSCTCSNCGYSDLFDVEMSEPDFEEEINELVEIIKITPDSFEDVIDNAITSKCYIEVISLVHNVIQSYLKYRIDIFFNNDKERFKLLTSKIKLNYLYDYNLLCYILGLISKDRYDSIIQFNKNRNKVIHDLLKKETTMEELRLIARDGRLIQISLSPLNHTLGDIDGIMKYFDKMTVRKED